MNTIILNEIIID